MRRVKQISAGLLLLVGFWCLARSLETGLDRNPNRLDKRETVLAGILLGVPAVGFGAYLGLDAQLQKKRQERDRLQAIFFKLVKAGKGKVAPLRFAMEANLTGEAAKAYLDERARIYDADFQVDDRGGVFYYFHLGDVDTQLLRPAPAVTFDVILEAVPEYKKREVVRTVQKLTGLSWKDVKALMRKLPQPIQKGAAQTTAEDFKRQLEAVGAQVVLVLRD
ncbi:MAG: ribosomal protein L7/L12 [Almyronema sp.]